MATFTKAPREVDDLIAEMIEGYHPDLVEAGARIGAVMAHPTLDQDGEPKGPPMVKDGLRILARVKKHGDEDRARGTPDASITFDAEHWEELGDGDDGREKRLALIDHELYHLVVKREKESNLIKTDDRGRPLFSMRPHDWEIAGFRAVVERHGRHSAEHAEARRFHDKFGNLLFDFASDRAADRPANPAAARRGDDSGVAGDTFRALLSVGHTEDQARKAIDSALAGGRVYESVAEMVDAIYAEQRGSDEVPGSFLPRFTPGLELFGCNQCHLNRTRDVPVCPACGSPEYSLLVVNGELEAVRDEAAAAGLRAPSRRPKGKAEKTEAMA